LVYGTIIGSYTKVRTKFLRSAELESKLSSAAVGTPGGQLRDEGRIILRCSTSAGMTLKPAYGSNPLR
jgi:hypothetical protein